MILLPLIAMAGPRTQLGHDLFVQDRCFLHQRMACRSTFAAGLLFQRGEQVEKLLRAHIVHLRAGAVRGHGERLSILCGQGGGHLRKKFRRTCQVHPEVLLHARTVALAEAFEVGQVCERCVHAAKIEEAYASITLAGQPDAMARKIFIVDDDVVLATMLADHLRTSFPHAVEVFHTGEDCLAHLSEHPDLVILDHHLNNVVKNAADGLRILQLIKKLDRKVHVIMLSSQSHYGIALQTVQQGAERYVIKGKDQFDEIDRIVQEVLG